MLDRPIPFNQRLRATWTPNETPNLAIDHMLQVLAAAAGSRRVAHDERAEAPARHAGLRPGATLPAEPDRR